MSSPRFEGWVLEEASSSEKPMVWKEYQPKDWEETDIEIKVTHSGICGTDLHIIRSRWGPTGYPVVTGHEIVGVATRVGLKAEGDIKVGDIVGVGSQSDSCLQRNGPCEPCENHTENYCSHLVQTYASQHFNGGNAQGGHALYHRAPSHFVFRIPDGLAPYHVAPLLCAGTTVYEPLKRYGAGPGKRVGIVGVGGLGHLAILFAKAMGTTSVIGISRKASKKQDTLDLGADDSIATDEDENWGSKWATKFDILISTNGSSNLPLTQYLKILKPGGTIVQLAVPDKPIPLEANPLVFGGRQVVGSLIGSPSQIREMLQFAVDKKIEPWVEQRPMREANEAMVDLENDKARFRYVLYN